MPKEKHPSDFFWLWRALADVHCRLALTHPDPERRRHHGRRRAQARNRANIALHRWMQLCIVLVFVVAGCATMKVRNACREQCSELRGPVHTLFGGVTLPPEAWDACMSDCEAKGGGDDE